MARPKQQVRIISGTLKGKLLRYPPGKELRPSMQQTKAAVFDSIGASLTGSVFMDLFAGAGGVGIEAISRGAAFVHFVEKNSEAVGCLEDNLATCGLGEDRAKVHHRDVFDFLSDEKNRSIVPGFVYADPPYEGEITSTVLEILDSIFYPQNCLIILEHRKNMTVSGDLHLERKKIKKFGGTWVSFFVPLGGEKQ